MDQPRGTDAQDTKDEGHSADQYRGADGRFDDEVHRYRPFFARFGGRARARALMLASSASSSASLRTCASTRPLTSSSTEPWQKRSRMWRMARAATLRGASTAR